jgi:hypothetical protein
MKQYIFKSLIIAAAVTSLASCDENSWNDKLDGFEEPTITDVKSIEYTLTNTDYATLAANSTNTALAGDDHLAALKLVGTQHYFNNEINPSEYIPALLSDSSFPYFALSNGSSVKVTYNIAAELPEEVKAVAAAEVYTVDELDYQEVWGSQEDYTESFAPSHTAAKSIPGILKEQYPDAEEGQYVIVNYNTSTTDPVFNTTTTTEPETPAFELSNVIGSVENGGTYDINGVVTAVCSRGFFLTDNSGSILAYLGAATDFKVGDQIKVENATISAYGTALQIPKTATFTKVGEQAYTYPTPTTYDLAKMITAVARTNNEICEYVQFTGKTVVSGNYYNIDMGENEGGVQGSVYYATDEVKAMAVDGATQTYTGYFAAVSSSKYFNVIVTNITTTTSRTSAPRRVATVPSSNVNAVYYFNGSTWAEASSVVALDAADYTAMGQTYGNLSSTLPATYLPIYLKQKYPYAAADDAKFVAYKYYNGSSTSYTCDQYVYDGTEWVLNNGVEQETAQFVKVDGTWIYNPDVTITLPAGKNQEMSTKYYQACVNWVYENVDVPVCGSTGIKTGMGYVTSYGNNEYYSGTSAYQGNVDLRPASARAQYSAGYEGLTDDEVVALMKKRFCEEVMPGALAALHPDAAPVEGLTVTYTINFAAYNGSGTSTYVAHFKVVGKGQFEFVDCDW